jgi:ribosomal protein S27AE
MAHQKRFCPNCGSEWVEPSTSNRAEQFFSGGNPNRWQCNDCDYTGLMPVKEDSEKDNGESGEIGFEPGKEYGREYTGFGPAYIKYILYVTLPLMAIYYLYLRIG